MKSTATFFLTLVLFFGASNCQSQKILITKDELPKVAQKFISNNFSNHTLDYIVKKVKLTTSEYKVKFRDGLEIKFDAQGDWKEVDGEETAIPTSFIPQKIIDYVAEKFPNTPITKIEKEKSGRIEIELSNDVEIEFNSNGEFLRIDY